MDLVTSYLGLRLENPLVASASTLSSSLDGIHRLKLIGWIGTGASGRDLDRDCVRDSWLPSCPVSGKSDAGTVTSNRVVRDILDFAASE